MWAGRFGQASMTRIKSGSLMLCPVACAPDFAPISEESAVFSGI
jgi:hypothetical protein